MNIRVIEPTSGKAYDVDVPLNADLAEIRKRIAAAVASAIEICELYQERTGKLLAIESSGERFEDGDVIRILPKKK